MGQTRFHYRFFIRLLLMPRNVRISIQYLNSIVQWKVFSKLIWLLLLIKTVPLSVLASCCGIMKGLWWQQMHETPGVHLFYMIMELGFLLCSISPILSISPTHIAYKLLRPLLHHIKKCKFYRYFQFYLQSLFEPPLSN